MFILKSFMLRKYLKKLMWMPLRACCWSSINSIPPFPPGTYPPNFPPIPVSLFPIREIFIKSFFPQQGKYIRNYKNCTAQTGGIQIFNKMFWNCMTRKNWGIRNLILSKTIKNKFNNLKKFKRFDAMATIRIQWTSWLETLLDKYSLLLHFLRHTVHRNYPTLWQPFLTKSPEWPGTVILVPAHVTTRPCHTHTVRSLVSTHRHLKKRAN